MFITAEQLVPITNLILFLDLIFLSTQTMNFRINKQLYNSAVQALQYCSSTEEIKSPITSNDSELEHLYSAETKCEDSRQKELSTINTVDSEYKSEQIASIQEFYCIEDMIQSVVEVSIGLIFSVKVGSRIFILYPKDSI